mmetsp:Transcript_32723/g.103603  ORF Transcript_32723/g.103603 Transcript_32723/m.103603 type:complete len:239 (-) Transcript_32723:1583-2299(-)
MSAREHELAAHVHRREEGPGADEGVGHGAELQHPRRADRRIIAQAEIPLVLEENVGLEGAAEIGVLPPRRADNFELRRRARRDVELARLHAERRHVLAVAVAALLGRHWREGHVPADRNLATRAVVQPHLLAQGVHRPAARYPAKVNGVRVQAHLEGQRGSHARRRRLEVLVRHERLGAAHLARARARPMRRGERRRRQRRPRRRVQSARAIHAHARKEVGGAVALKHLTKIVRAHAA